MQKHGADTLESPKTLTKEEKRTTFEGVMARSDIGERETVTKPSCRGFSPRFEGKLKFPSFKLGFYAVLSLFSVFLWFELDIV